MPINQFDSRIDHKGNLKNILFEVTDDFQLGQYRNHSLLEVGYEDYNLKLETDKGSFFIKIFAAFRTEKDCERYVNLMEKVIEAGVRHPKLIPSKTSKYIFKPLKTNLKLVVMEWIDGQSFFDSNSTPTLSEISDISEQAAKINRINFNLPFVYDNWAITHIVEEYAKWHKYLEKLDKTLVDLVVSEMKKINILSLPRALVHGDLIKTNVIRATNGKLYIVDFSVANINPRIQELAVLCCNLLFNEKQPSNSDYLAKLAIDAYQKYIKLTKIELKLLPLFIKAAHAMHIIGATKTKAKGEGSKENDYWLNLGRIGLKHSV